MRHKISQEVLERARQLIIREGVLALHAMQFAIENVWRRRLPDRHFTVSDGEMVASLHELVTSFGLASTLLFDLGPKRRSEKSASIYSLREDRTTLVAHLTAGIDTALFTQRKIRNMFAHIDEHLAKALLKNTGIWISDLGLSTRNEITSVWPINYCRVYVFDEDILLHLGEEFPIRKAYDTATEVLKVLPNVS